MTNEEMRETIYAGSVMAHNERVARRLREVRDMLRWRPVELGMDEHIYCELWGPTAHDVGLPAENDMTRYTHWRPALPGPEGE